MKKRKGNQSLGVIRGGGGGGSRGCGARDDCETRARVNI